MAINLALNRPATASNSVMPYTPSMAVNGGLTPFSRWLCNKVPGWLCVDFGAPYWINRWAARQMPNAGWRSPDYNMCDFKLQGSNDNVNWTDIDVVVNNVASNYDKTFIPVCFRYARLYVTKGLMTNTQFASVMEFEVYQAPSALLTGLSISSGAISPAFAKTTSTYTAADVEYSTSSVTVTPIAEDPQANIKVNGVAVVSGNAATVSLNVGSNPISIVVTGAGGGPVNTYTITVVRAGSTYLSAISCTKGPATPAISKVPPFNYSLKAGITATTTVVTLVAEDTTTTITLQVDANTYTSTNGTLIQTVPTASAPGKSLTATVSSSAGIPSTVYTILVIRAN